MILDVLECIEQYASLNPHFAAAFEFLHRADIADLLEGRNEIDGDNVFAMVVKDRKSVV